MWVRLTQAGSNKRKQDEMFVAKEEIINTHDINEKNGDAHVRKAQKRKESIIELHAIRHVDRTILFKTNRTSHIVRVGTPGEIHDVK